MKIIAVEEEKTNSCIGCCFYRGKCEGSGIRIIDGRTYDCSEDDIIYKEVEETNMNEMPKLEPGMILRLVSKNFGDYGYFLYLNDNWTVSLSGNSWQDLNEDITITEVWKLKDRNGVTFNRVKEFSEMVWELNPNQAKIEEIKKTLEELETSHNTKVSELKEQLRSLND